MSILKKAWFYITRKILGAYITDKLVQLKRQLKGKGNKK